MDSLIEYFLTIYKNLACLIYDLFKRFYEKKKVETESEYVTRKLNEWKNDMYASSSYLFYIPHKCLYEKRLKLIQEYNKNK